MNRHIENAICYISEQIFVFIWWLARITNPQSNKLHKSYKLKATPNGVKPLQRAAGKVNK
jgi:hypothetical protein